MTHRSESVCEWLLSLVGALTLLGIAAFVLALAIDYYRWGCYCYAA